MICPDCKESIESGDLIMTMNDGAITMHRECGLRGVFGSVAHIERRCSCYVPGSSEGDPIEMTRREAARAAVELWYRREHSHWRTGCR